jgi:hypothetical protein
MNQCLCAPKANPSAAPELYRELWAAHQIILNALNIMTSEQKSQWSEMNERDGLKDDMAVTREEARRKVLAKAIGESK